MSELFNRYVAGKKPAEITHNVVTDIQRGRISGDNLKSLISELDRNGILDNTVIKVIPKNEWNDEYLELLSYETIGGTFSKQYLLYLAEVAEYVNGNARNNKSKPGGIKTGYVVAAIIIVVALVIFLFSALSKG